MSQAIKIAVLPVAGLGTRVMPLTIHQPKAMIGIVDRPMIHYLIDELLSVGVKRFILVTGPGQPEFKNYIDYLQKNPEWKKLKLEFNIITQQKPIGNADPVWLARKLIGQKPFIVAFADDLLEYKKPAVKTLIKIYGKTGSPAILLEKVPKKEVSRYGVVKAEKTKSKNVYQIRDLVEKPKPNEAPSSLTIVGRYVLTPKIIKIIGELYSSRGQEIGIADALKKYLQRGGQLYGYKFDGLRFDAGSKLGILKAQTYFGLTHPEFKKELRQYLKKLR